MAGYCVAVTTAGGGRLLCKQGQLKQPTPVWVPLGKKTWTRGYNTHRTVENLEPPQAHFSPPSTVFLPLPKPSYRLLQEGQLSAIDLVTNNPLQKTHWNKAHNLNFRPVVWVCYCKSKDLCSRPSFLSHAGILRNRCSV